MIAVLGATLALAAAGATGEPPDPLVEYVTGYYRAVATGNAPPLEEAEREVARLLEAPRWAGRFRAISHAGWGLHDGEPTPFLSVIVGQGYVWRAAFPFEDDTVVADVHVYWDPVVPDFTEAVGRPRAGWADLRGDRLFLHRGYVRDAAVPYLTAALTSVLRRVPEAASPTLLRERPDVALALAEFLYAQDLTRPDRREGTLIARIEHETLWHEAQHLYDRKRHPDLDPALLEYRGMLRGLIEGDIPYVNVGRLAIAVSQPEDSPYREAAYALLNDLLRLGAEEIEDPNGVEDLRLLSAEAIRSIARDLYGGSLGRFWYRESRLPAGGADR